MLKIAELRRSLFVSNDVEDWNSLAIQKLIGIVLELVLPGIVVVGILELRCSEIERRRLFANVVRDQSLYRWSIQTIHIFFAAVNNSTMDPKR